jgi:phosphoglycolate phosphatase-like HAD superfamily hydrolase
MSRAAGYRHVIFDFDGVLCDSLGAAIEGFASIRNQGFPTLPMVSKKVDMCTVYAGSLSTCLHEWLSKEDSKRFFDLHSAYMADRCKDLKTFPGIGALLAWLGSASIVTSAYSDAVRTVLENDPGYRKGCIHSIAGRELSQPKTVKIHNILSALHLVPADAVYVGDLESDILYCRDVPIDIISVSYGYHPASHLQRYSPTYLVESVPALHRLLKNVYQPMEAPHSYER